MGESDESGISDESQRVPGGGSREPKHGVSDIPNSPPPTTGALGKQLRGDLPCVVCQYNLKGISIRDVCPECGTAVRATILAMVDPLAKELRPIQRPRLVAAGLITWGVCSFAAILLSWFPYVPGLAGSDWRLLVVAAGMMSAIGAFSFVRPHADIPASAKFAALLSVLLYVPALALVWEIAGPRWIVRPLAYPPESIEPSSARIYLRLALSGVLAGMLFLLRPNARLLVARSLALRTGRVDRQTIRAVALTLFAVALGDILLLISSRFLGVVADTIHMAGIILVIAGSALVTLGALGIMIDSLRIARSILVPTPSLAKLIHGPDHPEG